LFSILARKRRMSTESNALAFNTVFLTKNPPDDKRISLMARWGKRFFDSGLVKDIEGNLSFRTRLGFIISGTGIALNEITPETVAEVSRIVYGLHKTSVYVKGLVIPSRETILHSQIYEMQSAINAVFHVHDPQVMYKAEKLGLPVTSAEKAAGSPELAQEAVNFLKLNSGVRYFVLKNHGVIALGTTMDGAGKLIEEAGK
jgi:ribulose-5-phosphate 4-epimerase/fuculose-1-phosphate aldolase